MGKDASYEVIHRGEYMERVVPGKWLLIQRAREYGGGWWFGRGYDDCFMLEFEQPTSLGAGIDYILAYGRVQQQPDFDDDFKLT